MTLKKPNPTSWKLVFRKSSWQWALRGQKERHAVLRSRSRCFEPGYSPGEPYSIPPIARSEDGSDPSFRGLGPGAGFGDARFESQEPGNISGSEQCDPNPLRVGNFFAKARSTVFRYPPRFHRDADLPDYNVAIDLYENTWVLVQEYAPPKEIDPATADKRLKEIWGDKATH